MNQETGSIHSNMQVYVYVA